MSSISNELKNIIVNHPNAPADVKKNNKIDTTNPNEFSDILQTKQATGANTQGISVSQHAQKRLEQRSINLDSSEYAKLNSLSNFPLISLLASA